VQYFKGDETEVKFQAAAQDILDNRSLQKDLFLAGAYETGPLGDLIITSNRSPLSNAITQAIFRDAFKEIFEAFVKVGTFEAYITVFKKIFGEAVTIDFTVPAAGKLNIDIEAEGIELNNFITRYIVANAYVLDTIIDDEADNIVFQTIKGFTSQYDLELMLREMVPAGIFTEINLTLGA
jgi:hypothetical protein